MTSQDNDLLWRAKLAAWTHDPAEKALVLLRDPSGHEGGTVQTLRDTLFPDGQLPADLKAHVKRADHWASAADRPQFPRSDRDGRYAQWTQVNFDAHPELIHPLSGTRYKLGKDGALAIDPAHIKAVSTDHFQELIVRDANGHIDAKRTALAFWRFGPELATDGLGALWQLLPADTRIPDHTIWSHLDLSSAFASAFAADADANPALLSVSLGPVQDFIAAARTTSDLWAGSHLLSRIAWEGIKVVCNRFGPDAVVFPQLRGVPQVDLWLREDMGLPAEHFADLEWVTQKTDANPLFAAALPNKLVAIVPADRAETLAHDITLAVRGFVANLARDMLKEVLTAAGIADTDDLYCYRQLEQQLDGFPEVHWAVVPFAPLITEADGQVPGTTALAQAGAPFFTSEDDPSDPRGGFLATPLWKTLARDIHIDGTVFYRPNPGVLYPAVYELLDRLAASAKAVRPVAQRAGRDGKGEAGYRCDLTSDAEWLTHNATLLDTPKAQREAAGTLWSKASGKLPALGRKGEHLSAIGMLKRLWPSWFVKRELKPLGIGVSRFVVSTHTLAIATSLQGWLSDGAPLNAHAHALLEQADQRSAALPRKLMRQLHQHGDPDVTRLARALPALLDDDTPDDPEATSRTAQQVWDALGGKPETYYALILMDGDKMGAWISGSEEKPRKVRDFFHARLANQLGTRFTQSEHRAYLDERRAVSPARHMAISGALNHFALTLAQEIVENRCKGKLIYAGGDDLMALVSVDDLLACLTLLRAAYAGLALPDELASAVNADLHKLKLGGGHAQLNGKLLRLMGEAATASAGAVIAHHQAPLGAVLRALRAAEARAKTVGGRDAFAITQLKRSGGATELTLPWRAPNATTLVDSPMQLLGELVDTFRGETSRKAAYLTQGWLPNLPGTLPPEQLEDLLASTLGYQLARQSGGDKVRKDNAPLLGRKLAKAALRPPPGDTPHPDRSRRAADHLRDLLAVAEFLAREGRTQGARQS